MEKCTWAKTTDPTRTQYIVDYPLQIVKIGRNYEFLQKHFSFLFVSFFRLKMGPIESIDGIL